MSAHQPADGDTNGEGTVVFRVEVGETLRDVVHLGERVDTAGTTDEDLPVVLGVEVNEPFGTQHTVLKFHRTGKACLLIHGEQALDSGVLQLRVGDSR